MVANTGHDQRFRRFRALQKSVGEIVRAGHRDLEEMENILQIIKNDPNGADMLLRGVLPTKANAALQMGKWEILYRKLGVWADWIPWTSIIPPKRPFFTRLIPVPKGMTLALAFAKVAECMPARMHFNNPDEDIRCCAPYLTKAVVDHSYAVWCRDAQDPDPELTGRTTEELECSTNVRYMTPIERLLLEIAYHEETGGHLDRSSATLCPRWRDILGNVPRVLASDFVYLTGCYGPREQNPAWGAREVIPATVP